HHCQHHYAEQEGTGDGDAHQRACTQAEEADHHDHDQQDAGQHAVLQFAQIAAGKRGLVFGDLHFDAGWPELLCLGDCCAHLFTGLDDVAPYALGHFQREGGLAVQACMAFRVEPGTAYRRHITYTDDLVIDLLDHEVQQFVEVIDDARHLERET